MKRQEATYDYGEFLNFLKTRIKELESFSIKLENDLVKVQKELSYLYDILDDANISVEKYHINESIFLDIIKLYQDGKLDENKKTIKSYLNTKKNIKEDFKKFINFKLDELISKEEYEKCSQIKAAFFDSGLLE